MSVTLRLITLLHQPTNCAMVHLSFRPSRDPDAPATTAIPNCQASNLESAYAPRASVSLIGSLAHPENRHDTPALGLEAANADVLFS
jgi:hypothetical protein